MTGHRRRRLILCSYISGLMFLVVNNFTNPEHEWLDCDQNLIDYAIEILSPMVERTSYERLGRTHNTCKEMNGMARVVIERARYNKMTKNLWDADIPSGNSHFELSDPFLAVGDADLGHVSGPSSGYSSGSLWVDPSMVGGDQDAFIPMDDVDVLDLGMS
jgi:hypothetical protein